MKLQKRIDYVAFLQSVRLCAGEVYFHTPAGDQLNLKSMLSEYVFISAAVNTDILDNGEVICQKPEDFPILAAFLEG